MVVSAIYVVINFALTRLAIWLEIRLRRAPGAARRDQAEAAEDEIRRDLPSAVAPH